MVKKYLNAHGQTMSEFTIALGFLTVIGIYLMYMWIGPATNSGLTANIVNNAQSKIEKDPS